MKGIGTGFAAALLAVSLNVAAAEKVQAPPNETALDAAFLEYLASFEGEEEDWTWFADDSAKPQPEPADGKQSQSAVKPAAEKVTVEKP